MSLNPLVSVVVPSYNHHAYLPARIKSILAQSFTDYELLLLDDASTDGSAEYLRQFAGNNNVRLLINQTNSGSPFKQWNYGVKEAKGKYVWLAESDDIADITFLKKTVDILENNPQVGIVSCGATYIDKNGQHIKDYDRKVFSKDLHRWSKDFLAKGASEIQNFLYIENVIVGANAVLFRKSIYDRVGGANESLKLLGDWLQWMRMLTICDYYYLAEKIAYSRIHPVTQRQSLAHCGTVELEGLYVQYMTQQLLDINPKTVHQCTEKYATSWLQSVRSGRFSGGFLKHGIFLYRLVKIDCRIALKFSLKFPLCFMIWVLKRTLFRHRCKGI